MNIKKILSKLTKLNYAETHFKFKLPWSPLFKKAPTVFIDAPFQVLPGKKWDVILISKNAHLFNRIVKSIDITLVRETDQSIVHKELLKPNLKLDQCFHFENLHLQLDVPPGQYIFNAYFHLTNLDESRHEHFLNSNYKTEETTSLKVQFLQEPLPYSENWLAGEHHCHTHYTSDPVEFGAPPKVLNQAAKCVGLDFVVLTDHSYNFYYDSKDYMDRVDAEEQFIQFKHEVQNHSDNDVVLIPGIEVSAGNHLNQNIHLLSNGVEKFIDGHGDSGRRWLSNKPDLKISEVISQNPNCSFFAAHPKAKIGALEKFIFNRGEWNHQDIQNPIHGLQFWNGHRNEAFIEGKKQWISALLNKQKLLPIAGNDAHGDLNQNISVKTPLLSLKTSRNHLFGKVRTLWPKTNKTAEAILDSFKGDYCINTDGPFGHLFIDSNQLKLEANSNSDYGPFKEIKLFSGSYKDKSETEVKSWQNQMILQESIEINADYYRLEGETLFGNYFQTAPVYVSL